MQFLFFRGPEIGHFTAISQDHADQVGCGAISYGWNQVFLTCTYSYTNVIGQPVYKIGPSASGCKTGRNTKFSNLCSEKEVVDPNPLENSV